MKKLSVVLVSLAMLFSLACPAMAANEQTPAATTNTGTNTSFVQQGLTAIGGTPGKINVRLNDKCVAFPDAFPELVNGSTMVPVRAVMESLGATVENTAETIKISTKDAVITMKLGDKNVTVQSGADTKTLTLNTAPYLKSDRTYVPLRFISETFGYDVSWDEAYQCVVILDSKGIQSKFNERFSTLNDYFKTQAKTLNENWKSTGDMNIALELVNSKTGNKTYNITGKMTAHTGGGSASVEGNFDLSSLKSMVTDLAKQKGTDGISVDDLAMINSLLSNQSFAMKMQPEGKMYFKMGLYDLMFKELLGTSFDTNKETWYALGSFSPSMLTVDGFNVGNMIYGMTIQQNEQMSSLIGSFSTYDRLMMSADMLDAIMGNKSFVKQGTDFVWSFDKAKLLSMFADVKEVQTVVSALVQEMDMKMTFSESGAYKMSGSLKIDLSELGTFLSMSFDSKGDATNDTSSLQMQLKNFFNLTMKCNTKTTKTDTAPDTSIPQNAQIIDFEKLLLNGMNPAN